MARGVANAWSTAVSCRDAATLAALFRESVETLAAEDYDEEQRDAWASAADDEEAFAKRSRTR